MKAIKRHKKQSIGELLDSLLMELECSEPNERQAIAEHIKAELAKMPNRLDEMLKP